MTRSIQALRAAYETQGFDAPQTAEEAQLLARDLMSHPAYMDTKHRDHDTLQRDVAALYEVNFPEPAEEPLGWQTLSNQARGARENNGGGLTE